MEAPEKIYLEAIYPDNGVLPNGLNYTPSPTDIEYTRTDAFIEKAAEYLYNYNQKQVLKHGARATLGCGEYLERSSQLDIARYFFELGLKAKY